jgi:hypothetical protein
VEKEIYLWNARRYKGLEAGLNNFLKKFNRICSEQPNFRDELCVLRVNNLIAKQLGNKIAPFDNKLMPFYIVTYASCPKASQIMRANLSSPGDRTLQRKNPRMRNSPFIECEKKNILQQFDSIMKYLEAKDILVAIDGTAVVPQSK